MFQVALYEPEIAPNTGNIIRLCANTGCRLHLIGRLGFELDDRRLRRAGLDYHEYADVQTHADLHSFRRAVAGRLLAFTTRGRSGFHEVAYAPGDILLFGPETRGLPPQILDQLADDQRLRLPMRPHNRSLNLSNAVAVAVYEAWRQHDYAGAC